MTPQDDSQVPVKPCSAFTDSRALIFFLFTTHLISYVATQDCPHSNRARVKREKLNTSAFPSFSSLAAAEPLSRWLVLLRLPSHRRLFVCSVQPESVDDVLVLTLQLEHTEFSLKRTHRNRKRYSRTSADKS